MGVYAKVNGVARKVSDIRAAVDGAVRTVRYGFCGVSGVRRQFFGPLEDVTAVEIEVEGGWLYDLDANGNSSDRQNIYSAAAVSPYGSVSISGNAITVTCETVGKEIRFYGSAYAVFSNGRRVDLDYLSESWAEYGASVSFPISFYVLISASGSNRTEGVWLCWFGEKLYDGYVSGYKSGSKTFTSIGSNDIEVGTGIKSGSGKHTVQMSFSNITIDGRTVPVRVVSKLS